jgi:PAS domain S-box-containing protein
MQELQDSIPENTHFDLFEGEGEMASLMRAYNWEAHPMGTPVLWPQSLQAFIRLMLHSDSPMFIWWSQELYMFHNDAYLPALGNKHPKALGASARVMWQEIWNDLGQIAERILEGGKSFYAEDFMIILDRKGFSEETYWTFSYSPAPNDTGGIGGIFCACNEVTGKVLGQRRMNVIKNIADSTIKVGTVDEAGQLAAAAFADNAGDIPFGLIYLVNNQATKASLIGNSANIPPASAPLEVDILNSGNEDRWCLAEAWKNKKAQTIYEPAFPTDHATASALAPERIITHTILKPGEDKIIGFLVLGVSSMLAYDADYQNFHQLLSVQIGTSLASVLAREEAMMQQQELVNLFEQAPVAIAIMRGEKLVVELANPHMCEFWGRRHEQVINMPVFDALPEVRGQGFEQLLLDVLNKGVTHSFQEFAVMLNRKGKQERVYVNFIYYPFRSPKGIITGVTAIAVEVTEQVESRHEIEAKNKELIAINADLDNFVYSASHDLKGPILNIEGLMKVLTPKLHLKDLEAANVSKIVDMVYGSIDRLKDTINDLSQVSKVQKEANEDVNEIDIAKVVEDVISDMQLNIQEANAIIKLDVGSHLIRFSPKNLKSVVYNLLSNALKYRSPDRQPMIDVACKVHDNELVFSVTDNGLGMNLKYRNKIFSMFKRLHSHVEGSGVGLYIVKRIVENAGGRIDVESEVDKGATFIVYFKLHSH